MANLSCGHTYHYKCVKEWINKIPRHETALKIPKWPPIRIPKLSIPQIKFKITDNKFESAPQHTSLELSRKLNI